MRQTRRGTADCLFVPAEDLRGRRWDPGYWDPRHADLASACALPSRPLGGFIDHITYGPILTGRRPVPVARGVAIVGQKVVRPTGLLLAEAVTVAEDCAYDLPRCRLRAGDVVFCRSGVGSLGRRRFTVFCEPVKATVSCFVDLIRLRSEAINPYYVATFLRSAPGWAQIERQINGVGAPNLSFGEIRALSIPLLPPREQEGIENAWGPVRQAHAAGDLEAAEALLDGIVAKLEGRLLAND